jgi:transposase-like protein
MEGWSNRPLDSVYMAVFIAAIVVKVRAGQVANRSVYAVIGVTLEGRKDVLGLTMGTGGGEGAKFVDERARRATRIVVCVTCSSSSVMASKGLPEVVENVWPHTTSKHVSFI